MIETDSVITAVDISAVSVGASSVAISSSVHDWLGIVLTAISLLSVVIGVILRIITAIGKAKDKDSDGGETITAKELDDIISETERQTAILEQQINANKSRLGKLKERKGDR